MNPFNLLFIFALISMLGALFLYIGMRFKESSQDRMKLVRAWGLTSAGVGIVAVILRFVFPLE